MRKNKQDGVKILSMVIITAINLVPFLALGATSMPTPTVDDCVSRTGMTKEKCTEMISNFKSGNMGTPPSSGQPPSGASGSSSMAPPTSGGRPSSSASGNTSTIKPVNIPDNANPVDVPDNTDAIENITKISTEKEKQFVEIETRISKIIEFLQKNNVDVAQLESNLATFKTRHAEITNLFSTYIKALNGNSVATTTATVNPDDIKTQIKTALTNLSNFYTGTLKLSLNNALSNVIQ